MMHTMWNVDPTKVLTRRELTAVLDDINRQSERSLNARRNRVIVRLACCCGLRVSEIANLQLNDVLIDLARPHLRQGARGSDPFVCSVQAHRMGKRLQRHAVRRRFLSACWVLGAARQRTLTIHHGRHTFISHALAGGRTLAEVRAAAGHSNVAITSAYLHVVVDDEDTVGNLFAAR